MQKYWTSLKLLCLGLGLLLFVWKTGGPAEIEIRVVADSSGDMAEATLDGIRFSLPEKWDEFKKQIALAFRKNGSILAPTVYVQIDDVIPWSQVHTLMEEVISVDPEPDLFVVDDLEDRSDESQYLVHSAFGLSHSPSRVVVSVSSTRQSIEFSINEERVVSGVNAESFTLLGQRIDDLQKGQTHDAAQTMIAELYLSEKIEFRHVRFALKQILWRVDTKSGYSVPRIRRVVIKGMRRKQNRFQSVRDALTMTVHPTDFPTAW